MRKLVDALGLKQLGLLIGGVMVAAGIISHVVPHQTAGGLNIVAIATAIEQGQAIEQAGWNGGIVPYAWGGGHGSTPGPSHGLCDGSYTGPRPCIDDQINGVDCSGFVRWVYSIAFGNDVLSGNTGSQIKNSQLRQVDAASAVPGDIVFFGTSPGNVHHVGIYIGDGQMINALESKTNIKTDHLLHDLVGYYHFQGVPTLPPVGGASSVVGPPSVTPAFIDQVLAANQSPAQGSGQAFYEAGVKYGIDPVFALAFFGHESTFGKSNVASQTMNMGNISCGSSTPSNMRYVTSGGHCFQKYNSWNAGVEAWFSLISNYIRQKNASTIEQIIAIYAPPSDGNDDTAYINYVQQMVGLWRSGQIKQGGGSNKRTQIQFVVPE